MKIVLAPDKFKSCMTSPEICRIMSAALQSEIPGCECVSLPMADGGDGTVYAMAAAMRTHVQKIRVTGPLGEPVTAEYAYDPVTKNSVVEMASASGIALVPREQLDPLKATTYGTGEVIKALLDAGAEHITVGIGGSATVDGGSGMAQALGFRLLDANGKDLAHGGGPLENLAAIDCTGADPRLKKVKFSIACDVTSPLLGATGAARVFGPQKGATPSMVEQLEKNLTRLAEVWKKQGLLDDVEHPGDGAAGGLGAGLRAYCNAVPESGARLIMKLLDFEKHLQGADLVITGEGRTDSQTEAGKLCGEVAAAAHAHDVPVMLLSGCLEGELSSFNDTFDYAFSISSGHTDLEEALRNGAADLDFFCRNIAKLMKGFRK